MELRLSASPDLLEESAEIVSAFRDEDLAVSDDVGRIHRKSMFDLPPQLIVELLVTGGIAGVGGLAAKAAAKFGWSQLRRAVSRVRRRGRSDARTVDIAIEVKSPDQGWREGTLYVIPKDDRADEAIDAIESDLQQAAGPPFATSTKLWHQGRWVLEEPILESDDV